MKRVTSADLEQAYDLAWSEMFDYFREAQVAKARAQATYTITANTTSRTPAEMSLPNFGEILSLGERPSSSPATEEFTPIQVYTTAMPIFPATDRLLVAEWRDDTLFFNGATRDITLRIRYTLSGQSPTSGSCGLDGCLNFLAYRTASIAGLTKQMDPSRMADYDTQARGPARDGRGGFAHLLILDMVRTMQKEPMQSPAYDEELFGDDQRFRGGIPAIYA